MDEGKRFNIDCKIIDIGAEFNPTVRKCRMCDKEKYHMIFQPEGATHNLRSELFSHADTDSDCS